MRIMNFQIVCVFFLLITSQPLWAMQVVAIGEAELNQADKASSRQAALEDAMRQAMLRVKTNVKSSQIIENLQLISDQVEVSTQGSLENLRILKEWEERGSYFVKIQAHVLSQSTCSSDSHLGLRKKVAVAAFSSQHREHFQLGRLSAVEHKMAEHLVLKLSQKGELQTLNASTTTLFNDQSRAPTIRTPINSLTTVMDLAKTLGAQYVVSGVIRDMDMVNPEGRGARFYDRPLSWVGFKRKKPLRQFAVDVFIHEGVSGALLFQKGYATAGEWALPKNKSVGFATAAFWKSGYGKAVKQLVKDVATDLNATLRCQPFMSRIVKTEVNTIIINAGTGSGLRPGHQLKLLKSRYFYDAFSQARIRLDDTETTVIVKQVQPTFAIAEAPLTLNRINIQMDDFAVSW